MRLLRSKRALPFALAVALQPAAASASETTTYTYDALGRLVVTTTSGTINNDRTVTTSFDPAGNRTVYTVNGVAPAILGIGNASVTEGGTLTFTVTRSGNTSVSASVSYATANGTATAGNDYTATSGTLNFAAGQTSATITVATIDDGVIESAETMAVSLSSASANATIATATGTGTINDNDVLAGISISGSPSVGEGGNLVFALVATPAPTTSVSVGYSTANGTAVAPTNFISQSGTVTFAPGQTSQTVTVATVDDAVRTSDLTMTLNLTSVSSEMTLGTSTATGTIVNTTPLYVVIPLNGYTLMVIP